MEWEMCLPAFTKVDTCVSVYKDVSDEQMVNCAWNDDNPSDCEEEEIAQDALPATATSQTRETFAITIAIHGQ